MSIPADEVNDWLFDLFLRRDILSEYEEALQELAGYCKNRGEYNLLQHTMEKIIVLNDTQFSTQLFRLSKRLKAIAKKEGPLAVVAMAWDGGADSSQLLAQRLKSQIDRADNIKIFNSVPNYERKNNLAEFPRFVLIDDFSGTGKTVWGRYNHIINSANDRGVEVVGSADILFGMEAAFQHLTSKGVPTYFAKKLTPGISGYFNGSDLAKNINHMKRLEEELAQELDDTPLPSFGYGEAEALFVIKEHNAPNSNFPIFWWPENVKNERRVTIMRRHEF